MFKEDKKLYLCVHLCVSLHFKLARASQSRAVDSVNVAAHVKRNKPSLQIMGNDGHLFSLLVDISQPWGKRY